MNPDPPSSMDPSAFDEGRVRLAAIVSKSLDGVITSWNRGAERIFGWTAAEAVGRHITLIIPTERHAEETEVLARLRRGDSIDHFETIRVAKDGRLVNISLTVSPLKDPTGRIIGASKTSATARARRLSAPATRRRRPTGRKMS